MSDKFKKWLPWGVAGLAVVALVLVFIFWGPLNIVGEPGVTGDGEESKILIARVGNSKLSLSEYKAILSMYVPPEQQAQVDPREIIDPWVQQEVVYQEAKRMGLDKKDTVKLALGQLKFQYEMSRKQLLGQAWLAEEAAKITVDPSEAQNYFDAHKEEFLYEVKVSQIVVADPLQANQIYQQLKQGADFKKLAQQYSVDPLQGEPSTFLPRGTGAFTLPMEDAIFTLEPGEFTEPFITSMGLTMIFKLEAKTKVRKDIAFADVKDYIESMLLNERAEQIITVKLDSLTNAAKSDMEIHLENLIY